MTRYAEKMRSQEWHTIAPRLDAVMEGLKVREARVMSLLRTFEDALKKSGADNHSLTYLQNSINDYRYFSDGITDETLQSVREILGATPEDAQPERLVKACVYLKYTLFPTQNGSMDYQAHLTRFADIQADAAELLLLSQPHFGENIREALATLTNADIIPRGELITSQYDGLYQDVCKLRGMQRQR